MSSAGSVASRYVDDSFTEVRGHRRLLISAQESTGIKAVGADEVGDGVVVGISDMCNCGKVPSRLQCSVRKPAWAEERQKISISFGLLSLLQLAIALALSG